MADFKYITKLYQHPQGKQRVYFTCHPQDFKPTFEEIKKDILDRQDVAIFYLEPDTRPEEVDDYELQLGEMQLFVVPVTTKLLTTPNRAMDVEVPFAQEHHIPILPLMYESGLDELFNEKFGDLQYLDKFNTDPTAIPFDEKLTNYLESVIVGDELARQVRAAFDAYIFLSYRKKDRKYAQELMKLIHENDFARDIAIWYDEFLTPGEDFNNAIKSALQKSDLFALTVTPNLLEMPGGKPNFVMDKEFPAARDSGKPILPAEMLATNRNELNDKYNDIPEPVGEGDKKALSERLLALLKKIAIAENDKDPQHNYFIGLAYLSGIDVEVDHNRAKELITGAAEQDFIPAIKQLSKMYSNGKGVQRSTKEAVKYRNMWVCAAETEYQNRPEKDNALNLIEALTESGKYLDEVRLFQDAEKTFEKLLVYARQFENDFPNIKFDDSISDALHGIANAALNQENYDKAESYYHQEIEFRKIRVKYPIDYRTAWDVYAGYDGLGSVALRRGDYSSAEKNMVLGAQIILKLMEDSDKPEVYRGLATIYEKIAEASSPDGASVLTEYYYRHAFEYRQKIAEELRTGWAVFDYALSHERLGQMYLKSGQVEMATEHLEHAREIFKQLSEENDNEQIGRAMIINCEELAAIEMNKDDPKAVEELYAEAIEISKKLLSEIVTPDDAKISVTLYRELCDYLIKTGDTKSAYQYAVFALKNSKRLLKHIDNAEMKCAYAKCCFTIGNIEIIERISFTFAEEYISEGFNYILEYYKENPDPLVRRTLMEGYDALGTLAHNVGNTETELSSFTNMKALCEEAVNENADIQSLDDLAVAWYKLGVATRDEECFLKAISIYKDLSEKYTDHPEFPQRVFLLKREMDIIAKYKSTDSSANKKKKSIFDRFRKKKK